MASSFMAEWVYTDTVKDHFMNPRNLWKEDEDFVPDGVGEVGSLACGDQMRVGIKVRDGRISDLRWLTYGCASAIASTSMMSEMAISMTLEEAYHLTPQMITEALGGLPEHKFHCSVLGDKALRAAIDDYFEKNGIENTLKGTTAKMICECQGVTDQMIEELVKTDKVHNFDELQALTGCSTVCGRCRDGILEELNELLHIYGK